MVKISKDATKVPKWLKVTNTMVPDFVARDYKVGTKTKRTDIKFEFSFIVS